jgi:MYXO-CTERM domain-containing protein
MPSQACAHRLVLGWVAVVTALLSSDPSWAATITVDPAAKYQTMTGWEVSLTGLLEIDFRANPNGAYDPSLNAKLAPAIIGRLVNDLGIVAFDHLKSKYGLTPNALEIILEPENTNDWKGGTPIGQAIVAAKARLHAAGFDPEIIAPSVTNASNAVPYFNDISNVAGASAAMTMLSYHRYGSGDYAGILSAAKSHGLQTGMLELTTGTIDVLLEDLTVANVSAWQKWGLVVDSRIATSSNNDYAYIYADLSQPANPTIGFSPNTGPLLPVFRYVRSGAIRIDARSSDSQYLPVAFMNTNGSYVMVVRANNGAGGTLAISPVPDGTYGVKSVSFGGQITDGNTVSASGGTLSVAVPSGVTAIYDQKTPGPNLGSGAVAAHDGGAEAAGGPSGDGGRASDGGALETGGMAYSDASNSSDGTTELDGAADVADASRSAAVTKSGCGCRIEGPSSLPRESGSVAGAALLMGLAARRRRRTRLIWTRSTRRRLAAA